MKTKAVILSFIVLMILGNKILFSQNHNKESERSEWADSYNILCDGKNASFASLSSNNEEHIINIKQVPEIKFFDSANNPVTLDSSEYDYISGQKAFVYGCSVNDQCQYLEIYFSMAGDFFVNGLFNYDPKTKKIDIMGKKVPIKSLKIIGKEVKPNLLSFLNDRGYAGIYNPDASTLIIYFFKARVAHLK